MVSNAIDSIKLPKYLLLLPGGDLCFFASFLSELATEIDLANNTNTWDLCHFQADAFRASMSSTVISFPCTKRSAMVLIDSARVPECRPLGAEPSSLQWKCGGREK